MQYLRGVARALGAGAGRAAAAGQRTVDDVVGKLKVHRRARVAESTKRRESRARRALCRSMKLAKARAHGAVHSTRIAAPACTRQARRRKELAAGENCRAQPSVETANVQLLQLLQLQLCRHNSERCSSISCSSFSSGMHDSRSACLRARGAGPRCRLRRGAARPSSAVRVASIWATELRRRRAAARDARGRH